MTGRPLTGYVGEKVELHQLPVERIGLGRAVARRPELRITGRYEVVEYEGEDREAGILGSTFLLVPEGTADDDDWADRALVADAAELLVQMDPARVEREREEEARWEAEALEEAAREAEGR